MNGNRMKYASTPTYGMQKRSFLKKSAPVHQVPDAPDFSKAPGTVNGMPFQQPIVQPVQQQPFVQQPVPQQPSFTPSTPYYMPGVPMQQPAQIPFAAPTFVPPVSSGMPIPPQTGMQQPTQQLPLGNTISNSGSSTPFSMRGQGFVPPQPAAPVAAPNVQPAFSKIPTAPLPPFGAVQRFGNQPFIGTQPQNTGYPPVSPQMPGFTPAGPAQPEVQPSAFAAQQPAFSAAQSAAQQKPSIQLTADKLWSIFLFGLLPLLFIPCIFVPSSWDFLRYAFLVLTVIGLGGLWYRQMYASSTRLIVSMVYVALSIAAIAMLMQGGNDIRQTSADISQPAAQQQTISPEGELATTPEPAPAQTPAPAYIGPSEAERRLEIFMSLWQMNNTTEMVSLVQPSWCSKQENPSQALFNVLKNRTPEDYVIEDISGTETDNSRTITMRATINKNTGKAPVVYRFMVMMVKEGNEWYVNPNSLATNDEVETVDENVVNNKNAVGNVTEPPRTTVTPAPPASTLLYYNEGANYYHMDPNCASVKSEYLPFDFSFSYGDLKAVMREYNLSPCLKCNAPTNTLD